MIFCCLSFLNQPALFGCPILAALFWLSCPSWLFCSSCPVLVIQSCQSFPRLTSLSWQSCPSSPFLHVLFWGSCFCNFFHPPFWLSFTGCHGSVLLWLSYSGYPALAVQFWLSCSGCPVPEVLFRLYCSSFTVLAFRFLLFWLSCSGPCLCFLALAIKFWLCCFD